MINEKVLAELKDGIVDLEYSITALKSKGKNRTEVEHAWRKLKRQARHIEYIMNKAETQRLVRFYGRK